MHVTRGPLARVLVRRGQGFNQIVLHDTLRRWRGQGGVQGWSMSSHEG